MPKRSGICDVLQKRSGVYKITNLVTRDFYIGSSRNIYFRHYTHRTMFKNGDHDNKKIRDHAKLYGRESFIFEVLEYCDENVMHEREQYFYDQLQPTYNAWTNVLKATGFKHSADSIERTASKNRGKKMSLEARNKMRESWILRKQRPDGIETLKMLDRTGKKHSEETKIAYSLERKGKKKPEGFREKISSWRTGTKLVNGKFIKKESE